MYRPSQTPHLLVFAADVTAREARLDAKILLR
jgi:hypothetical protein